MTRARRLLLGLAAALPLLLTGCIKSGESSGAVNGTTLYLFDSTAPQILVWKDLSAVYDAAAPPAADLALTSSALTRSQPLAWGGMAMDTQRNHLYLLYQDGSVIRIDQLRSQSGTVQSNNLILFTLDSSQRLTGSVFGQLALDTQTDTLYACESGTSGISRVWAVSQPDVIANSGTAPFVTVTDDESGTGSVGAAAGQNGIYAYFAGGNQVTSGISTYNGPRLRKGASGAFGASNVIIGGATGLDQSATGSLALDTANSTLFVGLDTGSTSAGSPTGGAPILAFQTGQFGLAPNQQPRFWLGDTTTGAIMALSHAGTRAWLLGLQGTRSTGVQTILVWKQPAAGVAVKPLAMGPTTAQYLAAAMDGTGS
ncbi:MAG TPA: hypothetical protein VFF77_03620 [Holophagaceae bacterium]|nr:hypothetical protein [Holophagaceae bacterium]